jgi:hypothetical protein
MLSCIRISADARQERFLHFVILIAVGVPGVTAVDRKISGNRVLLKENGILYVMTPDGTDRHKIAANVGIATLSSDGNLVSYADTNGVYVFALPEGQSVTVARLTEGHVESLVWSPDRAFLAYDMVVRQKSWDLFLASYPPNGEAPRNLGHWYETDDFSPDGKFIVHPTLNTTHNPRSDLETVSVETGKTRNHLPGN